MKWSVGLITAPRDSGYYLDQTLESFEKTGWDDPTVFAEPGSPIPSGFKGHVVERRKRYGDWTNWATALYDLLLSDHTSDYFMMLEDDVVFNRYAREYLEWLLPQVPNLGTLSIYTPRNYSREEFVGVHNCCKGFKTCSTQSVIFSKESAISFFTDEQVQRHRHEHIFADEMVRWSVEVDVKNSIKDAVIGQWALKNRLGVYFHCPSLAEHIGHQSTLIEIGTTLGGWMNSADFVGEDFDIRPWMQEPLRVVNVAGILLG